MNEQITQKILEELNQTKEEFWNISSETSNFLQIIINTIKPQNILEIGTSNGFSSLQMNLTAHKLNPQPKIITLEKRPDWAPLAEKNIAKSESTNITLIIGNALETIPTLKEKINLNLQFNLIFIDAMKRQYIEYIKLLESNNLLSKKCIILADNVISHSKKVEEYINYVKQNPAYFSKTLNIGPGLEITIKK
jgi:predicted O-methyltransferase YrrM